MLTTPHPCNKKTDQPKGFAFIEYANPALAADARDEMNQFVIKGQPLEVVFAQERRKTPNEMRGRVVNQHNHRPRSSSFERQQRSNAGNNNSGGDGGGDAGK